MPQRFDQDGPSPQARLRRDHERVILRAITVNETVSRTQLASDHGLSAQSVGRIVRDLLSDGLIEETSTDQSDGPGAPRIGLYEDVGNCRWKHEPLHERAVIAQANNHGHVLDVCRRIRFTARISDDVALRQC